MNDGRIRPGTLVRRWHSRQVAIVLEVPTVVEWIHQIRLLEIDGEIYRVPNPDLLEVLA